MADTVQTRFDDAVRTVKATIDIYQDVEQWLLDENARLRELVLHMHDCIMHADTFGCDRCPRDDGTQACDFEERMSDLGIGVSE